MKRFILLAIALIDSLASFTAPKTFEKWEIDKQHTSVSFDVGHYGISKIRGLMNAEGSINTDPSDITKTEIEVRIDVKSLNTMVSMRDTHVKSDDFLSAEQFPFITFKSTSVREDKNKNKIFITGDLTIKGITKKAILESTPISEEVRIPKDGGEKIVRAVILATTSIDRYDFGIDYGKNNKMLSKLIDGGVGREISISISTEFVKTIETSNTIRARL